MDFVFLWILFVASYNVFLLCRWSGDKFYHVVCIVFFMGCLDWEGWLGLIRFVGRIVSTRLVLAVVVFFCVGRYKGLRAGVHTYIIVVFRPFVLQEF